MSKLSYLLIALVLLSALVMIGYKFSALAQDGRSESWRRGRIGRSSLLR